MSDTPETDANLYGWAVEAELSRKLERERDEARRLATEYRDAYGKHFKDGYSDIASLPWEKPCRKGHEATCDTLCKGWECRVEERNKASQN